MSECPECGSHDLEWQCSQVSTSGVPDGRLRLHEVRTVFYLGCNYCSATLKNISGDDVARQMSQQAKEVQS